MTERLLTISEVAKLLAISKPTLRLYMLRPDFPKRIVLGERSFRFRYSEIIQWLEAQPRMEKSAS